MTTIDASRTTFGLLITGTDTDVGKTFVTAMIARMAAAEGVVVGAYKPACSGSDFDRHGVPIWQDIETLSHALGNRYEDNRICPQRFAAPLSPPASAWLEGRSVDSGMLREAARWWENRVDLLLVEGVGGLLCPLTETETVADLAVDLAYPLIIVARLGLGTINQTLLTVEAAEHRNLTIAGIILNEGNQPEADASAQTNPSEIERRCKHRILGIVGTNQTDGLRRDGKRVEIDWLELAGIQGERPV